MLTPEYLNLIEFNDVVKIYNKLNIEITADIIDRVSKMQDITATTKKQLEILKQTNGTEIFNKTLEKTYMLTAETKEALRTLFEDMAKEDIKGYKELYQYRNKPFKLSENQYNIINQGLKQTNRLLKNMTNTIAFQSKQAYVDSVDKAYMKVVSGAFDYNTAIKQSVQELADKGITLKDKLGRNVQLEVAVRRNVLSGIHETANNINRDIEEYLGCDGYEVTAHIGARPTHAEEQGKQFAINSKDADKYKVGLWSDVVNLWSEYNCRHTYFGIILGISEPVYTDKELKYYKNATVNLNGKKIPYYEATQKQRQLENAIRKQKRTVQILEKANQDAIIEKTQLAQLQKKYNEFCKETRLEKDYGRLQVAKNNSTNSKNNATIKVNYIRKNKITNSKNLDRQIKKAIKLLPDSMKELIKDTKIKTTKGNSHYNRKKNEIYLLKDSKKYEVLHEIAHAIETKLDILHDNRYIEIQKNELDKINPIVDLIKIDGYGKNNFVINTGKFISDYQRLVYEEDIDRKSMLNYNTFAFNTKTLGEYFSEGFRCYFENNKLLKRKDIDLYNYIKEVLK